SLSHETNLENLLEIQKYRVARPPAIVDASDPAATQAELDRAYQASGETLQALIESYQGHLGVEYALYGDALARFPNAVDARYFLKQHYAAIIDLASGGALVGTTARSRWLDWVLHGSR